MYYLRLLPPVVCRRTHVLFTFGSSLPPVVCRRTHVLFTLGSSLYLQLFVGGLMYYLR